MNVKLQWTDIRDGRQAEMQYLFKFCLAKAWRPGFDPWAGKIPWRRERLPTPVFWPGEFHGLYSSWDCKESDMTLGHSLRTDHHPGAAAVVYVFLILPEPDAGCPLKDASPSQLAPLSQRPEHQYQPHHLFCFSHQPFC